MESSFGLIPAIDAATELLKPPLVALGQRRITTTLFMHDKVNLGTFCPKDAAIDDSTNFPAPGIIAVDIVADLKAALGQFTAIEEDLKSDHGRR